VLAFAMPAAAAPPVADDETETTLQGNAIDVNVLVGDTDPDGGQVLDVASFTQPLPGGSGVVTEEPPSSNTLRYTPSPQHVGQAAFTYQVCDDLQPTPECDEGAVNVTVNALPMNVADVTPTEGNAGATNANFDVTLSQASSATVTVNFATANGTAVAGADYTATSGTITFVPGDVSEPIPVSILGDALDELDETFSINLSGASGATVNDGQAVATITDDDPLTAVSVGDLTTAEGDAVPAPVAFNVTLAAPSAKTVSVDVSTANGSALAPNDYQATGSTMTFAPGETQKSVFVNVVGDTTFEADESFALNLSNPVNATIADGQGVATIQNNDMPPSGGDCDITGTPGADRLTGTNASERICGLGGNDVISGGGGDDEILGGSGNDRVTGGAGADAIEGGSGNDRISGGAGGDAIEGGGGRDVIDADSGDDSIDGEGDRDVARGGTGEDVMDAGPGDDTFSGGGGTDRINGGAGNDRIVGDAGNDFVDGGSGNDNVQGGAGNDRVRGLAGNDRLTGGAGNDQISGGGGEDHVLFASRVTVDLSKARANGEGRDRVVTVEVVTGSPAGDTLIGNSAPNTLNGARGNDRIFGGGGADHLNGGPGNDLIRGDGGRDLIIGSAGNDTCDIGPGGAEARSC
jgi:Ca2+-binding RTX toxin-like protein